jgi:hypothetical protein
MGLFDRIKEASDNVQAGLDLRTVDPELLANGLAGTALVTAMHDTKIAFGQHAFSDPVVAFELEVRLPEREPYAVAFQQRVPHLLVGAVIPGATVSVRVDRSDSQRVAIDFEQAPVPPATPSSAGASAADPLDQLERLAKLHEQGVITDAELAEQKQKLLGEI